MATQQNHQQGFSTIKEELEFIRKRLKQLETDIDNISEGSGLAVDGSTTGATTQEQVFTVGVYSPGRILGEQQLETGLANTTNGKILISNSAAANYIEISSTADKQLKIDNTGHNVEIGVNTAAESGITLNVGGTTKLTGIILGDGSTQFNQPATDQLEITAAEIGINTTPETGISIKTTSAIKAGSSVHSDSYLGATSNGDLTLGTGENTIVIDGAHDVINITTSMIKISSNDTYSGTFDPATIASIQVINGLIVSVTS